jgi:hypothetical protein
MNARAGLLPLSRRFFTLCARPPRRRGAHAGRGLDLLTHPEGRHGFDILDDDERTRAILRHTVEFLRGRLAP